MGLFGIGKGKKDDKKKADDKSAKVNSGKPVVKETDTKKKTSSVKALKGKSMKDLYGEKEIDKSKVGTSETKAKKSEKKVRQYGNAYKVLVKPLITEKAANLGALNKYIFAVSSEANKIEITKAVNELYGVKPINVNVISVKGKKVRHGRKFGKRKDWKKAIITLPKGKSINIYEGV